MATAEVPEARARLVCPLCKRKRARLLVVGHSRASVACATCTVDLVMHDGTVGMGPVKVRILQLVAKCFAKFETV
jgi:hypothetical protein